METRRTGPMEHQARSEAVVWIDHEQALIVASEGDGAETVEILDRALIETETAFETRATDAVIDVDRVVVSGPADARTNFERAYVAITHRPDRLVDVEPLRPGHRKARPTA